MIINVRYVIKKLSNSFNFKTEPCLGLFVGTEEEVLDLTFSL